MENIEKIDSNNEKGISKEKAQELVDKVKNGEYKYIQVCYPLEDGSGDDFWNEVSYSYNKDNNGWEIATQEVYMGAPQYGEDAKRSSIIEDYVVKNLMRDKNFSIKLSPSNRESAADDLVILV